MADVVVSEAGALQIAAAINAASAAHLEQNQLILVNLGLCAESLADIMIVLKQMKNQQEKVNGTISEMSSSIKQQTQTAHDQSLVQNMIAVDQIRNNAIQQAETKAALERAGLESAPLPDIKETIKQTVTDTTAMRGLTEFQNAVTSFTKEKLETLVKWIKDTKVYTAGSELIDGIVKEASAFIKGLPDLFKPSDALDVANAELRKEQSKTTSGSV